MGSSASVTSPSHHNNSVSADASLYPSLNYVNNPPQQSSLPFSSLNETTSSTRPSTTTMPNRYNSPIDNVPMQFKMNRSSNATSASQWNPFNDLSPDSDIMAQITQIEQFIASSQYQFQLETNVMRESYLTLDSRR